MGWGLSTCELRGVTTGCSTERCTGHDHQENSYIIATGSLHLLAGNNNFPVLRRESSYRYYIFQMSML